ncbi:MAG: DUF6398 domain-containing protein [Candidatus Scalindua sp.]|nr:DUF6398 domain-containing protein [Candidatus Scalindua sp.]
MSKNSQCQNEKNESLNEIKRLLESFFGKYLNEEYRGYALKLCDTLGRKRKIDLSRGKREIWAASIMYVIARLNFLFDKENENYLSADTINNFFNTSKSTVGSKAALIEEVCDLTIGAEGYCRKEISDSLTFYQSPEGFIFPKSMMGDRELILQVAEGQEAEEIEKYMENQRKAEEGEITKWKKQREEKIRKKAEEKRKKSENAKDYTQLKLFDDE